MKKALMVFGAGALGAVVSSLVVWSFGRYGINQSLGVSLAPGLTRWWLYPRIVWGGIWGFLFLLSFMGSRTIARGLVLSLIPTAAQLFFFFPFHSHHGVAGLELGLLTPLLVLLFNAVWGVTTSITLRVA